MYYKLLILLISMEHALRVHATIVLRKVQVDKDQEKAQSEKRFPLKNRGGEN